MQRDAAGIEAQRERFFCVNQYLLIFFFYQCGVDGLNFLIAVLPEISKINDTGGILHHLMRMETVIHIHSISFTAAIERNFLIILQSYVSFPVD